MQNTDPAMMWRIFALNIAQLLGYLIIPACVAGLIWLFVRRISNKTVRRVVFTVSVLAIAGVLQLGHAYNLTH